MLNTKDKRKKKKNWHQRLTQSTATLLPRMAEEESGIAPTTARFACGLERQKGCLHGVSTRGDETPAT